MTPVANPVLSAAPGAGENPGPKTGPGLVAFGPGLQLTGILTGPVTPGALTLILPSAGLQPRAGPFRLHVELAQRLALQGINTFRFDVPGVGEAPRVNGCDGSGATVAAIDTLQAMGCSNFVVGGVCSAADIGWATAVADARVRAVLLLDGISFIGPWFHYARMLDRLRRAPREWRRMLRAAGALRQASDGMGSADFRDWPTPAQARQQFAQLVSRNVGLLWIYTGGFTDRFLHRRQFGWTFGPPARDPRVVMHYWPDCDHTFYARAHRDRLLAEVERWLTSLGSQARQP